MSNVVSSNGVAAGWTIGGSFCAVDCELASLDLTPQCEIQSLELAIGILADKSKGLSHGPHAIWRVVYDARRHLECQLDARMKALMGKQA